MIANSPAPLALHSEIELSQEAELTADHLISISRVRAGDEAAAEAVFMKYAEQLARLAEQNLSQCVARRVDGADVVQSVFRTFFVRAERGEFQISSSAELWKLLVQITLNKARQQGRRNSAGLRDVRREVDQSSLLSALVDDQPGPEDAAILNDVIEQALQKLPATQQPHYRKLIELKLADFSNDEIAEQLGIVRRTVERMLKRLEGSFDSGDRQSPNEPSHAAP